MLQLPGMPALSFGHGLLALHVWVQTWKFWSLKKWQSCDTQWLGIAHVS